MTRMLLASTGGHLTELVMLADRLPEHAVADVWVTFESEQSRRLLAGRRVEFVRNTPPRDLANVVRNIRAASSLLRKYRPVELVTNGAGIALSFAPLAVMRGISTHYIECSARTEAPSLTGRVLERIPRIHLYAQDKAFALGRWHYGGSVFDRYEPVAAEVRPVRRVVVTVGSLDFSFRRLIDRLRVVLPRDVDLLLQIGRDAEETDWPGAQVCSRVPPDELAAAMERADVVIAHAGIGSALAALEAGKAPILVPRSKAAREHVDDHQQQIAKTLASRGLAIHADAANLSLADIGAASRVAIRGAAARRFDLRD